MHFLCYCGFPILDSSDNLSYKANIIADQDWDDIWTWYEKLEKDGGMDREKNFAMFESLRINIIACSMN